MIGSVRPPGIPLHADLTSRPLAVLLGMSIWWWALLRCSLYVCSHCFSKPKVILQFAPALQCFLQWCMYLEYFRCSHAHAICVFILGLLYLVIGMSFGWIPCSFLLLDVSYADCRCYCFGMVLSCEPKPAPLCALQTFGYLWPILFFLPLMAAVASGLLFTMRAETSSGRVVASQILLAIPLGATMENTVCLFPFYPYRAMCWNFFSARSLLHNHNMQTRSRRPCFLRWHHW